MTCSWGLANERLLAYHDTEWGVPVHDDRKHFEFLVLDAFQAGLSWAIVLNKRENFRQAFAGFDPARVARFTARDVRRLLGDAGIVRNRLKVEAAISNASAFLATQDAFGSFDAYIWQFAPQDRMQRPRVLSEVPAATAESDAMSKDLKRRGFRFVGSTICYAFMQSAGLVDDHVEACFRAVSPRGTSPPA